MEGHDQSLHTGQQELQRGEGVSGPRSAAGRVRASRMRFEASGESADGRRQPRGHALRRSAGAEQKIMDELKRFIEVANHSGDLEKYSEAINKDMFPCAEAREMGGRVDPCKR